MKSTNAKHAKMQGKMYISHIDRVKIIVLKSFSDPLVLKLFGNLFHKGPA